MPSPRKRKAGVQIGRVLAKGSTEVESTFTTAQLNNLVEIGLFGHDGDGGFTQGATGKKRQNNAGGDYGTELNEDAGLDTVAELTAKADYGNNWDTTAARYYLKNDVTLTGFSEDSPATDVDGILHCPAGPDAKTVGKLEDVSAGVARSFWVKPTGWSTNDGLRFYVESACPNNTIAFFRGDDGVAIGSAHSDVVASGTAVDVAYGGANNNLGVKITVTMNDTSSTTENAGWHVSWRYVANEYA